MLATYNLSAAGFLVLDTLCAHADEMPPKGGATFVERMAMTVAGTAGATAYDCAMLGLKVHLAFGKTLEADLTEVLVRSVANPRALLTLRFASLSNSFAS